VPFQRLGITLLIDGPLVSQGSGITTIGADAECLQYRGRYVVPGSHIKGHLRHAWTELKEHYNIPIPVERWLGRESLQARDDTSPDTADGEQWAPRRGLLVFSHFFFLTAADSSQHDHIRVALNSNQVVKDKALQIVRSPWTYGATIEAKGWIEYNDNEFSDHNELSNAVKKGLQWAGAIGSEKGVGFGSINEVTVAPVTLPPKRNINTAANQKNDGNVNICGEEPVPDVGIKKETFSPEKDDLWKVTLAFDRPLCFAQPHIPDTNRLVSTSFVPGAALIANIANSAILDAASINKLTATNATPNGKPTHAPVSWLRAKHKENNIDHILYADAANHDQPFVFSKKKTRVTPGFVHAFKNIPSEIKSTLAPTADWLEVRTAITPYSRLAKDQSLFSMLCLDPDPDTPWHCHLHVRDLTASERRALYGFLCNDMRGPFGKTDAMVNHCMISVPEPVSPDAWIDENGSVRLMITASACLLEPGMSTAGATDNTTCLSNYNEYWKDISDDSLFLKRCFVSERMAGGMYIHRRFSTQTPYQPDILTEAGSVFLLEANPEKQTSQADVLNLLQGWYNTGLPDSKHYRNNPYDRRPWSPRNGYGAIAPLPPLPQPELPAKWRIVDV